MMERAAHRSRIYTIRTAQGVSWFEPLPAISIAILEAAGMTTDSCVVDVGGGDSLLLASIASRGLRALAAVSALRADAKAAAKKASRLPAVSVKSGRVLTVLLCRRLLPLVEN